MNTKANSLEARGWRTFWSRELPPRDRAEGGTGLRGVCPGTDKQPVEAWLAAGHSACDCECVCVCARVHTRCRCKVCRCVLVAHSHGRIYQSGCVCRPTPWATVHTRAVVSRPQDARVHLSSMVHERPPGRMWTLCVSPSPCSPDLWVREGIRRFPTDPAPQP